MPNFRPRLWFSLRTFFLRVTVCAAVVGYVGWQWRIVRDRNAAIAMLAAHHFTISAIGEECTSLSVVSPEEYEIPRIRRLLGEQRYTYSPIVGYFNQDERTCLERAFPEATITGRTDWPDHPFQSPAAP